LRFTDHYIEMCFFAKEIQLIEPQYRYDSHGDQWNSFKDKDVWLPSQEQLQDIVHKNKAPDELVVLFYKWLMDDDFVNNNTGITEMWLMYVMYEKFGKKWDGNKWA